MVKVVVSVGATMITETLTGIPFGGTMMVVSLTETERLIGGGEKAARLPQPIKARTTPEQATPILERCGWCIRNSRAMQPRTGLLNFAGLQRLLGYFFWCTRPLLEPNLVA